MSQKIIEDINHFIYYKLDTVTNKIINKRTSTTADIDELLKIISILDGNIIKYELTSNFDIQIL